MSQASAEKLSALEMALELPEAVLWLHHRSDLVWIRECRLQIVLLCHL